MSGNFFLSEWHFGETVTSGSAYTSSQSWTIVKKVYFILKRTFFTIVQLWRLVYAEPLVLEKKCINIDWSPNMWLLWAQKAKGYTLIWNGKSQAKTVFDETVLWYMTAAYQWTSYTSRISEKLQKTNEGHEGQIEGQTLSKIKILYFFHLFGVIWS